MIWGGTKNFFLFHFDRDWAQSFYSYSHTEHLSVTTTTNCGFELPPYPLFGLMFHPQTTTFSPKCKKCGEEKNSCPQMWQATMAPSCQVEFDTP